VRYATFYFTGDCADCTNPEGVIESVSVWKRAHDRRRYAAENDCPALLALLKGATWLRRSKRPAIEGASPGVAF
jgi:hypothetical protein